MVQELLSSPDIDPNLLASAHCCSSRLPLLAAVQPHVPISILEALLSHPRVDVNARDPSRDWSALHFLACRRDDGNDEAVEGHLAALLKHPRIRVNDQTEFDSSALHLACRKGVLSATSLLLRHPDVDINLMDAMGETPLHKACIGGHSEVVRLICMHGGCMEAASHKSLNANARSTTTGLTPLHEACIRGYTLSVSNLFSYYPLLLIPQIQDRSGCTALHLAVKNGHLDTAYVVQRMSMADVDIRYIIIFTPIFTPIFTDDEFYP